MANSGALDFETNPSFTLTVTASDGTLSDTAAITVNLNNLNDNAPAIADATVAIDENSANGTAVTNVSDSFTGTDLDRDGDPITYSITGGNTGGAFAINAATGAITVANSGALDFETNPSFTLTVTAVRRHAVRHRRDHGQPEQPQRQRAGHRRCHGRDRREQRQRHCRDQRQRQLHRHRSGP